MDARFTKAEAALLLPNATAASRREAEVEAIRLAAAAARNEAIATLFLRGLRRITAAIVGLPHRFATYNALRALSDRELRDIGMTRYDIGRVFDADLNPRPANDAGERPSPRAA
ncbi:DUF1127 domain-containing protein [Roseomonas terrae]|jgi:uncharacterized protein YjiS (DUF1127 family)|uniref:DUF1127 domain-containing protein n=1 Tax=Neoroseomonas terrae TaxID=424799 RepID=A0ABS5EP97_9PROT|nr:DUF1127 domain-containing protein [Neoroseomonas terrae]MBR0652854.1 DUF1127 domain-containing protein [Neoroseomonas terrae]